MMEAVHQAVQRLEAGGLVIFPTETVYGLGADACNADAVANIYQAKGRPPHNPLIIHCRDAAQAFTYGAANPLAQKFAATFWPGALTIVLPCRATALAPQVTANLPTVAVRVPHHPAAQALLQAFANPIAAPSVNKSGLLSVTRVAHLDADLTAQAYVLPGDPPTVGLESTIIKVLDDGWQWLRPGAITLDALAACAGQPPQAHNTDTIESPGQLLKHYAPQYSRLRLEARDVAPDEALLAFGASLPGAGRVINLSPQADLNEAAANLYAALHQLDSPATPQIAVMPIPDNGIGQAINERLRRAAIALL